MFWYCGELIGGDTLPLNIYDSGLLYGATVFTTIRVYHQSLDHALTHWQQHGDRLSHSLNTFGWQQPDWHRLRLGAEKLISTYPVLRIAIFADGREFILGRHLPPDLNQRQQQGVTAYLATLPLYQRSLGDHKTGNYLSAYLALQKAQQKEAKEAILVNAQGHWLETSTGNLWGWQNGCWHTPPLTEAILPGIARQNLLNWLQSCGLTVKQTTWDQDFVADLEAIAYSNSVVEIIPIAQTVSDTGIIYYNQFHHSLDYLRTYFLSDRFVGANKIAP